MDTILDLYRQEAWIVVVGSNGDINEYNMVKEKYIGFILVFSVIWQHLAHL